jgi:peptide/nickel transport system permease protein
VSVPVVILVAIFTFSIIFIAPGDAAFIIAGEEATPEQVERIRTELGLDKPFLVQFGSWLSSMATGDFGQSLFSGHKVTELFLNRLPATLSLTLFGFVLTVVIGVPLGIVAGWKAHTKVDRAVMIFAVLGFSIPGFWLGFMLIWQFSVNLHWFPSIGYTGITESVPGFFRSMTLPSLAIAAATSALVARMTRSSMLEVLGEDYVRTARAKGLGERIVLIRHALKAASLPVITIMGLLLAGLLTGVVVTETVFTLPGLGRLLAEAVVRRDVPVIQAVILSFGVIYVFVNLLTDIAYAYLDPRVRY